MILRSLVLIHQDKVTNITNVPQHDSLFQGVGTSSQWNIQTQTTDQLVKHSDSYFTRKLHFFATVVTKLKPSWGKYWDSDSEQLLDTAGLSTCSCIASSRQTGEQKGNSMRCSGIIKGSLQRNGSSHGFGSDWTQLHCHCQVPLVSVHAAGDKKKVHTSVVVYCTVYCRVTSWIMNQRLNEGKLLAACFCLVSFLGTLKWFNEASVLSVHWMFSLSHLSWFEPTEQTLKIKPMHNWLIWTELTPPTQ